MLVYDWLVAMAGSENAIFLKTDLPQKRLLFMEIPILDGGVLVSPSARMPDGATACFTGILAPPEDPYAEIQRLYAQFKHSVPGKHERLNKGNFKAVSSDALSYAQLLENMPRLEARLLLEGFIVCGATVGLIPWKNPKHFFWQGADPDCIIYRDWIV